MTHASTELSETVKAEPDVAIVLPSIVERPGSPSLGTKPLGTTGRFGVLSGPRTMRIEKRNLPVPQREQVRLRLEGCGVCGSSLPVWEGRPWFTYPLEAGAPGHEGWGIVDAVGSDVSGVHEGDRVAALSYHAFAEFDVAEASQLVRLPPELAGQPFPGEALGCAVNVFHRAQVQAGQNVAVVGVGFLGAVVTQLAAAAGARVIAISRRETSLRMARRMGARETIPLEDRNAIVETVRRLTNDLGCERVIEATGLQAPLDLATDLTAIRGKLVIAGYHQDGPRQVNMQLWNWRGLDVINAHERDPAVYLRGIREAIAAVASGRLDPAPLYTHQFRLEQVGEALDAMRDRDDSFFKAILRHD